MNQKTGNNRASKPEGKTIKNIHLNDAKMPKNLMENEAHDQLQQETDDEANKLTHSRELFNTKKQRLQHTVENTRKTQKEKMPIFKTGRAIYESCANMKFQEWLNVVNGHGSDSLLR